MTSIGAVRRKGKINLDKSFLSTRFVLLILIFAAVAIVYVHVKNEKITLGYSISENKKKAKDSSDQNEMLRAEFMKLKSPQRIEKMARGLGFKFPTQEDLIYVEEATVIGERK